VRRLRVAILSPFAGDVDRNLRYARAAMSDSIHLGEAPFVPHLLYPTHSGGVLDDQTGAERAVGMECGLAWIEAADWIVAYVDLGISPGMQSEIDTLEYRGVPYGRRWIEGWS